MRHTNDKFIKIELAVTYWECITLCLENVSWQLRPGVRQRVQCFLAVLAQLRLKTEPLLLNVKLIKHVVKTASAL